jgi:glutamyl-tRNA reductase
MELIVIGLNHRTAPIDVRERLAFTEASLREALCQANALSSLKETMILSTCNRVELYGAARNTEQAILDLKTFLSEYHRLPLKVFERNLYIYAGEEAVTHIFRVASSLDSMVVGEPQILGQIKDAYELAAGAKTSGMMLHRLLHRAFHVAKRVRTETKISNSAVSVSSVAVGLAKKIFESLEKKTVLLIGAGEMCELAAQHLVANGIEKVLVANRTHERAVDLAREFRGEAIPFEEVNGGLKKADIVISATGSPQYLLRYDQVARVMRDRKQKPIFFIDIADPRDIDPTIQQIENAYLYNIDDLQSVANDHIKDRGEEAKKAERIVADEVLEFVQWYRLLDITPTIVALRTKFDDIRKRELDKTLSLHPDFTDKEKKSLDSLTSAIINKILHEPLTVLKRSTEDSHGDAYLDALQGLFQLQLGRREPPADGPDEKQEKGNA